MKWLSKFADIGNKYAPRIKELVETIDYMDELERRVLPSSTPTSIQLQLQLELRIALISF